MNKTPHYRVCGKAALAGLLLLAASGYGLLHAGPIYVTPTGTDLTGPNWTTPTSLTNALAIATNGSAIWLAQGAYTNTATFTVRTNCTLYGGFTNGMVNLTDRNWTNYPTVLNGLAQNLRVVTVTGTNVTIDGLSISNGYGAAAGGITKAVAGNLTMANCRIVGNSGSGNYGSGVGGKFTSGTVLMTNCVVAGNTAIGQGWCGFGLYSAGATLQLVDCLFSNNYGGTLASQGLALYFDNGTLNALRTDFIGNNGSANDTGGGGAVCLNTSTTSATFSNCVFRNNVAVYYNATPGYGGAMWANMAAGKTATVANCTFKDNANMGGNGGAIYVSGGTLVLKNSIFWTNAVASGYTGREIYCAAGGVVQIGYSCLGGLASPWLYGVPAANMSNVMTNNPLYASATDVHLQSPAGRWDPGSGTFVTTDTAYSPCIDAGDPATSVGAEQAPNGNRVNLGAYGGTAYASMSTNAAPVVADLGVSLNYTMATLSGQLVNASAVIANVGVCYGTNSVAGNTTNGWQYVGQVYPPQQTGTVFSVVSPYPYLLTNTTYYYQWYATNAYGGSWTTVSNFTTGGQYPPGLGVGGGSNVIHVKKDAVGAANGQDWSNAYTTVVDGYSAVNGARTNIWIAGGVYSERSAITVGSGLTIIGGFAGTETNAAGRALTNALGVVTNYTSLNGEGTHQCLGITAGNVWLDTLVFSNCPIGQAVNKGGTGALTMNNCRITGNSGPGNYGYGVGGKFTSGTVLMTNCVVASNTATTYSLYGFGLYSSGASLQLVDCLFANNNGDSFGTRSGKGVGLAFDNGTLVVTRTDFIGNAGGANNGDGGGGAVWLGSSATMSASFSNCVFRGNLALYNGSTGVGYGGAVWANLNSARTAAFVNCTFAANTNATPSGRGGAICLSQGTLVLKNCILWTNLVTGGGSIGHEIYVAGGSLNGSYCELTGLVTPYVGGAASLANCGAANNPLFASGTDLHLQSPAGRWDPATGTFVTTDTAYSPCIDAGDPATSVGAEQAPNGNRVNLGAYGGTAQASMSPNTAPVVADLGVGLIYTKATFSGQLVNASAVIADVGVCYGTNSVVGNTTNGWQIVGQIYPPQQTGVVFSVVSPYPYLLTNTTYYYQWYATNAYGGSWTAVSNFTTGGSYPPGWGVGGGSNVIHVKKDAVGVGNGVDWYNAYTKITDGLLALGGTRTNIWIAGGTYSEGALLTLSANATVIGGFAGTETNAAGRALTNALGVVTNYTAINGEGTHGCLSITAGNTWLDTLVFSNGNNQAVTKAGAGALTMANCRLVGNSGLASGSAGYGVGGYFTAGTIFMTNCVVSSNTANWYGLYGFGIYSSGANLQLVDCLVSKNYGDSFGTRDGKGVGLAFDNGTLAVTRTDFIENAGGCNNGTGGGGAVYLGSSATMSASFSNCVFRGNQALYNASAPQAGYGGAVYVNLNSAAKTAAFVNCTFAANTNASSVGWGGAIYVGKGTLVIRNSIFWTNSVRDGISGREIYATNATSFVTNSYCCFSGTNAPQVVAVGGAVIGWGAGNITIDPLFASATDLHLKSKAGRWNPVTSTWVNDTVTSPCLDAGDPADPVGLEPMPNGHRIDMGAYGGTAQASKTLPRGTIVVFK